MNKFHDKNLLGFIGIYKKNETPNLDPKSQSFFTTFHFKYIELKPIKKTNSNILM